MNIQFHFQQDLFKNLVGKKYWCCVQISYSFKIEVCIVRLRNDPLQNFVNPTYISLYFNLVLTHNDDLKVLVDLNILNLLLDCKTECQTKPSKF